MVNIKTYNFPRHQYVREETVKTQIYLHHTAGNASAINTYKGWQDNVERIATHFVISNSGVNDGVNDGEIIQGYDLEHWAYHLGIKESTFNSLGLRYKSLDKISIGIELCAWGQLTLKENTFYNYVGKVIDPDDVTTLDKPFKGYRYWHSYSDAQIDSLAELLIYIRKYTGIDARYMDDIFAINQRAMKGIPGIYTHNSVRRDKNDVYPCPRLVKMLTDIS